MLTLQLLQGFDINHYFFGGLVPLRLERDSTVVRDCKKAVEAVIRYQNGMVRFILLFTVVFFKLCIFVNFIIHVCRISGIWNLFKSLSAIIMLALSSMPPLML